MLSGKIIYLLLLVPIATEILESGKLPASPRDLITDCVMMLYIEFFILRWAP